jgi:hypothetical protein
MPSETAGRERERFTDSPVEQFMKPGPHRVPPVVNTERPRRKLQKKHSGKRKH